jgi:NAD(P)H-dependent FMN reductase
MTRPPFGVEAVVVRVLLVCGSLQSKSANRAALDVVVTTALARGALVDDFERLRELPPFDAERVDDEIEVVDDWRARVDAADVLMIAAPEYAGGVAGTTKNALDWLVGSGNLYDKPVGVLSAGTSGGEHARSQLARTLAWQGAYVVAELGIAVPRTKSDEHGHFIEPATLAAIAQLTDSLLASSTATEPELVTATRALLATHGIESGRWRLGV